MPPLPHLTSLPAFEATARLGSVRAASNELGRTSSAVSKQLSRLANDLGGELFEKQGNGLKLTAQGESLLRKISPLLNELAAATMAMRSEKHHSRIIVGVSPTLASRWLMPRLPSFRAAFGEIDIFILNASLTGTQNHAIDVLLSYDRLRGDLQTPNYISLGETNYGLVCADTSHASVSCAGGIQIETQLVQNGCFHSWKNWSHLSGRSFFAIRTVEFPHHFLALDAAAAGLGVALAERRLVEPRLAVGDLMAPFGFSKVLDGFRAMITPRGRDNCHLQRFIEWLQHEARKP
jgi:LysR family glycine cleavage system transcriptional activator